MAWLLKNIKALLIFKNWILNAGLLASAVRIYLAADILLSSQITLFKSKRQCMCSREPLRVNKKVSMESSCGLG